MSGTHRGIAHRVSAAAPVPLLLLALAAAPALASDGLDDTGADVYFDVNSAATDLAFACAAQSDGKVLLAGSVTTDDGEGHQIAVARLELDGDRDPTFDTDGRVVLDLSNANIFGREAQALALAVDRQGRILVGGVMREGSPGGFFNRDVGIVIRLLANGTIDGSWQSGYYPGVSIVESTSRVVAMGFDAGGRFWVVGPSPPILGLGSGPWQFELLDDAGYSTHVGPVDFTGTGVTGSPTAMAFEPDGNVLIGGFVSSGGHASVALARIRGSDFAPDPTFGINGSGLEVLDDTDPWFLRSVALQPDLRIVIAGEHGGQGQEQVLVTGLDRNGTFGSGWEQSVVFPYGNVAVSGSAGLNRMVVQSDGKVLVAAFTFTDLLNQNETDVGAARLSPVGDFDTSFGGLGTGKRSFDMPPFREPDNNDTLTCLTLSAGKPVLVGSGHFNVTDWDFSFKRLTSDLIFTETFASGTTFFWSATSP